MTGYTSDLYLKEGPYFGVLIERYGNRIKQGKFSLDGKAYTLALNNSPNTLHGGKRGFDKVVWTAQPGISADGQTLALNYVSKEEEEDYPRTFTVKVITLPLKAMRCASTTLLLPTTPRPSTSIATAI